MLVHLMLSQKSPLNCSILLLRLVVFIILSSSDHLCIPLYHLLLIPSSVYSFHCCYHILLFQTSLFLYFLVSYQYSHCVLFFSLIPLTFLLLVLLLNYLPVNCYFISFIFQAFLFSFNETNFSVFSFCLTSCL